MPDTMSATAKLGNVCRVASSFVAEKDCMGFPRRGRTMSRPENVYRIERQEIDGYSEDQLLSRDMDV